MKQPKKLHPQIKYSSDLTVPDVEMELDEFITIIHEHLDSHELHEDLSDFEAEHIGDSVFLTEDLKIDEKQFEDVEDSNEKNSQKTFINRLIN